MSVNITVPCSKDTLLQLKKGDRVRITGMIYMARDAAHKELCRMIKAKEELPLDLEGAFIYYAGPCPGRPGQVIGSCGPTTSGRMDPYAPLLMEKGLYGMIGKGERSREVIDAMIHNKVVYFAATGGAGALLSERIKEQEIVAFPELGAEALRKIYVENFPVIVAIDAYGNNIYERGNR